MSTFTKEPHKDPTHATYIPKRRSSMHTCLFRNTSPSSGFTLIETMVVVGLIFILAAIATPNYNKYVIRSRQNEARTYLYTFFTLFRTRFAETGTYVCDGLCGFTPPNTEPRRYSYRIGNDRLERSPQHNADTCAGFGSPPPFKERLRFRASATANIDTDPFCDLMSITETGRLEHLRNDAIQ